jgi:Dodecin
MRARKAVPSTTKRERTARIPPEEDHMAESVYKVIELVGTSSESWEKAAAAAVSEGWEFRTTRIRAA